MLFSDWQPTTHAVHPMQAFTSIAVPRLCPPSLDSGHSLPLRGDVGDEVAVLASLKRWSALDLESLGRRGTGQHRVVPGQLGNWLGQLLQPPVVRESSVENGRIVPEDNREAAC